MATFLDEFSDRLIVDVDAFTHFPDFFGSADRGVAIEGLMHGAKAGDGLAGTSDDDFFAVFGKIEELGQLVFRFEGAYFFHNDCLNRS